MELVDSQRQKVLTEQSDAAAKKSEIDEKIKTLNEQLNNAKLKFSKAQHEKEQSEKIIEDILLGMINKPMVIIKQDRRQAIEYAVTNADMNDFVLVAGKGHENYQEINGRRLPYSDREIVSNLGMLN